MHYLCLINELSIYRKNQNMGRTIEFEIRKDGKISTADKKIFTQLNNKYNSENIVWSCANFWIDVEATSYNKL
jgi:hypothetical protein